MLMPEFFRTATIRLEPDEVTPLKTKATITEDMTETNRVTSTIARTDFKPSKRPLLNSSPVDTPATTCTGQK